ncbi:MAG: bacteriohemerythrin [Deferrisomatales bacterium]
MPILQWHDRVYAVGIPEVDRQHRQLFQMINDAYDAADGGDPRRIGAVLQGMAEYARDHFTLEERLMRESGYDRTDLHLGEHDAFAARARAYEEAAAAGRPPEGREVFRFLAEWLSAHILEVDARLASHLNGVGAPLPAASAPGGPSGP